MYLSIFFIRQILHEMWLHKLRSSLAIFCIAFGTFAVVVLLALGDGFYKASYRNIVEIADNSCFVWRGNSSKSYQGYPKGQTYNFKISDIVELPKALKTVEAVAPASEARQSASISYESKKYSKNIYWVTPEFLRTTKINIAPGGRFINQVDIERQARVAVLGDKVKTILFGKQDVLGLKISINNVPFTVIGILIDDKRGKNGSRGDDVFISYKSYISLYGDQSIPFFLALPKPEIGSIQFEKSLRSYFGQKYHFDKDDKEAMGFFDISEIFQYIRWFLISLQLFLAVCGIMTLAVGSVGVANIMFLIITERTYEIGLRKAIGSTDRQIFLQLLLEALIIIGVGGGIGLAASLFVIILLQSITLPSWLGVPTLSWITVAITIFVLALIGLVAGFFPARRAAKIDPIEALT